MDPRIEEAKKGERKLFFVDAAHFVFGAFLGYVWSFTRLFVKTPAGRQRYNVLGALDAITKELISITNTTYINAESVCQLMIKISNLHKNTPITLVLDNARYQKCILVAEMAKKLNIELLYIPPYSPNLNLIERLWKFVKKECLYSKFYTKFQYFTEKIQDCLDNTQAKHKEELSSLLTLNFQFFKKTQFMPE